MSVTLLLFLLGGPASCTWSDVGQWEFFDGNLDYSH